MELRSGVRPFHLIQCNLYVFQDLQRGVTTVGTTWMGGEGRGIESYRRLVDLKRNREARCVQTCSIPCNPVAEDGLCGQEAGWTPGEFLVSQIGYEILLSEILLGGTLPCNKSLSSQTQARGLHRLDHDSV